MSTSSRTIRSMTAAGIGSLMATVLTLAVAASPSAAHTDAARHRLAGSTPGWVTRAAPVSDVTAATPVTFSVLVKMRDAEQAQRLLTDMSTPGSARFRKPLTTAQFRAQFAPTDDQVGAVQAWLRGQGMEVTTTLGSGMVIGVRATAAQIEKTFATDLKTFHFANKTLRANTADLSLAADTPQEVTGAIGGVVGIDQTSLLHEPADTLPGPATGLRAATPCSAYFGATKATGLPKAYDRTWAYAACGYGPQQYQTAYGLSPLLRAGVTGRGMTVAVTGAYASPTLESDVARYNQVHRQPQFAPGQLTQITPGADDYQNVALCRADGWYGEETMDVEAVHAMAPGAAVRYVGGYDCGGGLDMAFATAIDNHVADIVSNSWGTGTDDIGLLGQNYIDFYNQLTTEAGLTGMTVLFATGDLSDHTLGGVMPQAKTAEFPADLPNVTAVGGTSVAIDKHGRRIGEWGWQNAYSGLDTATNSWTPTPPGSFAGGGGGGTSQLFAQPDYQAGVVPDTLAGYYGNGAKRVTPDVAMPADPNTGFLVGVTQTFSDGTYWDQQRSGGTSLATPLFAGVLAVTGQLAGQPLGFVNPALYHAARLGAFYDVTAPRTPIAQVRTSYVNGQDASAGVTYNLQTIDTQNSSLHSAPGYDDETGLGTPSGTGFYVLTALLSRAARN